MRRLFFLLCIILCTATVAAQPRPSAAGAAAIWLPAINKPSAPPFYAFYYLWWSTTHWQEKLGPNYPWDGSWPLPGTLDATTGCGATSLFAGNTLVDVPAGGAYDQLTSPIMAEHVREAAASGLTGFLAGWKGTGQAGEGINDSGYNKRLDRLIETINTDNTATGGAFRFAIDYETFGEIRTAEQIGNDLDYLLANYADDPAWGRMEGRRLLRWSNSKDFPTATLQAIAARYADRLFIIGEERPATWTAERAQYLDGAGHYWSSQDPYRNPQSFQQNQEFAATVHAAGRRWFAPLAPGYNDELNEQAQGHVVTAADCVPRKGTDTLRALYEGNRASAPDGWFVISWNEWLEHTYIEPSKRYGSAYLDELANIIASTH
jgi:hypothetical protein